jgi:HK97 family phage major capsid protein
VPVTESGGIGAAFTPEQWAQYVLDHLSAQSVVLASGATEIRTSFQIVHVPRITGDGGAAWYDELEPIGPGDPTGDDVVLQPRKCAALTTLSNESVADSSPSVLDAVGVAMTRAVALAVDKAFFTGTGGKQPVGLLTLSGLPSTPGAVDYAGLVSASGAIRAAGGKPDVAYVNAADLTALQLATDGFDRPLIQPDPTQGMSETIAGLRVYPTPAVPTGTALVAQADQIVVAVREDASVEVSEHVLFGSDGTQARVIARADVGVNDINGLNVIKASAGRSSKAS